MQPRSHTAPVPNLHRAVAECTQPHGAPASVASIRSLQTYLSDGSCVDAVYRSILARACAQPLSEAVITKCIALIRQCVARYPPSAAVLAAIAAACRDLAVALPPHAGVQKSLLYLGSSVTRTADSAHANKRLAKISARSAGSNSSSRAAWPQSAADGDLAGSSSSARAAAAAAAGPGSVHSSASEDVLGALQAKGATHHLWGSAEQQQQQQWPGQQSGGQGWAGQGLGPGPEAVDLAQLEGVRAVPQEPVLPSWTFQPSALQELWGLDPDDESDLDWSVRAPQLNPSLVPLVEGLPGMEQLNMMSCQGIVDAITGTDVATQLRQMRELTGVRRLQCGVTPELLQQAMQQCLANRGRRLFQPMPYTQQEQADVLASDVAAVVEIVCGKPSPTTPSAITGAVGLDDPDLFWQQQVVSGPQQPLLLLYQQTSNLGGTQSQQQQQRHAESVGQISSCILVKMLVDLWLSVGGAAAFPLVLRMLQQALYQLQPQYRARAFDIIYNLALHGSMLMPAVPASPPPSPQMRAGRAKPPTAYGLQALSPNQQQQPSTQQLHASQSSTHARDASSVSACSQETSPLEYPSPPQSPRAHAVATQQQQQQQSPGSPRAAAGQQVSSSWSPQASPRGRSRLSRSQLAGAAAATSSSKAAGLAQQDLGQQQQRVQLGGCSNSSSGSLDAHAAGSDAAAGGRGDAGTAAACGAGEALPIEVAWEAWLHQLLFELLLMLSLMDEPCEAVWQSALGCLLHLTTHAGHWVGSSLVQLPPAAAAALLDACIKFHWSPELHARLVQMAVNLMYLTDHPAGQQQQQQQQQHAEGSDPAIPNELQEGAQQQQQQQQADTAVSQAEDGAHTTAPTSPEDVSVTVDSSSPSQPNAEPPGRSIPGAQHRSGSPTASKRPGAVEPGSPGQHSTRVSRSQLGDLDLPWQLHAGPVDEQQLAAFGGPTKLLQHFCHAGSVEAQRTLLVPLLQVLMPPDVPDTAQLAVLQVLCARPSCLAALQAVASAGLPGWSRFVLQAVQQQLGTEGLDVPLLSRLLLRLEQLSMQHMAVPTASAGPCTADSASSTAGTGSAGSTGQHAAGEQEGQGANEGQFLMQLPAEVQLAMQLTLQQLRGELPAQLQARPGLQPTDFSAYQVQAEVQGAWKALRALCWCDDELARLASRHWLQQLLAVTLQQSLKGIILLPLPGVQQAMLTAADAAGAARSAAVVAACEAWAEVLQQLAVHCPQGTDLLVDALQLHMTSCKLQMQQQGPQQEGGGTGSGQQQQQQQQRQRAATARECVQAWAFVCQWVMQARISTSQAALTRLAAIAQSMACVLDLPEWPHEGDAAAAAAGGGQVRGVDPQAAGAAGSAEAGQVSVQQQQQQQQQQHASGALVDASTDSLALTGIDSSRDFEAGFRGIPPLEPSSEPSALTRLWGGPGGAVWAGGSPRQPGTAAAGAAAVAAEAVAAEGVCWPQAFLMGCAVLNQQVAQVLSGASLAVLLVRLLQCRPLSRTADRGFHGRPSSYRGPAGSGPDGAQCAGGVVPCPVLFPWSDGRQDLQLGLLLMLISSCSSDVESFGQAGLEAVTQQVLSGCTDPRVCLLVSQFMLEHMMQHQQDRYWTALRQLVTAAQQANDERLLGNPFLQLITLLSDQQQKPGSGVQAVGAGMRMAKQ